MIKTIKTRIVKGFKEEYMTLGEDNKKVIYLRRLENAFKKTYKVNVEVRYIHIKHNKSMTGSEVRKGYHRAADNLIIVFVCGNRYKDERTLFHELTHAFQSQKMNADFKRSKKLMDKGITNYKTCWHERHARHCAELLAHSHNFNLDLKNAFNYAIAA